MSSRLDKFHADANDAIALCKKYNWSFSEFQVTENTLSFVWNSDEALKFALCVSEEDYPENSLLTQGKNQNERTDIFHKPVPYILVKLKDDLVRTCEQKTDTARTPKVDEEERAPGCQGYNRTVSTESGNSVYTDCTTGDSEDEEMDFYYSEEQQLEADYFQSDRMNQLLAQDMEQVRFLYGEKAVSYRLLEAICEIDVELCIPLSFLDREVAAAWKLNKDEPLIIRLHLSSLHYLDIKEPPRVEVLQPSKREKFGLGSQMRKIMENFLSEQWRGLSNQALQAATTIKSFSVPAELSSLAKTPSAERGDKEQDPLRVDDSALAKVIETGFSSEVARNALIITRGNVEEALNLLLTNPESCSDVDIVPQFVTGFPKSHPTPSRQSSHPPMHKKIGRQKQGYGRQKSIATSATTPNLVLLPVEDLSLLPSSTLSGKNAKQVPSFENGFLVQIFRYARQRIPTLNEYCVVCDEPHVFQNGAMLKPAVCSRELCVFAFQTLGVMVDAADDIATGAEVVVLLLAMTKAACASHRKNVIFDPYPTIVDPKYPSELAVSPKNKDYAKVQGVLNSFPTIQQMMRMGNADLKKQLDSHDHLAYPLLQWIISSNRSHIVKLPPDKQLSFMHTPHQFLLLSSPPAKEAKFREARNKHGSTFAFHGSSIENWHSIIRQGLIVASGTNKQMNGAAYGKGIYLSPSASVSFGYSRMGYGYYDAKKKEKSVPQSLSRFLTSDNITCVALCEVITSPDLKKNREIWVCPHNDYVCTRFFCVYEDGQVGDNQINTQQDKYREEILKAVGYRYNDI